MSRVDDDWRQELIERFHGREVLTKQEMYARYFNTADLQREAVFECLDLIEFEYDFPVGLLRPEDRLEKLIKPVPAANPWRWLVYRTREGDTQTEINYQLGKRMRQAGTIQSWSHVENFADLTVRDLIRAWCGLPALRNETDDPKKS